MIAMPTFRLCAQPEKNQGQSDVFFYVERETANEQTNTIEAIVASAFDGI